ncbi:glycosyltransferase [Bacteroides sp. AN502(2024)]|uniref:glycosyltransferase n=1 Tax=Bacteroides sp. AN502(2024) TaxID=3160599 RepID=UPI0035174B81
MINVAFYLGNNTGSTVNAINIENGNPGVGGTQYVMLLVAHYLSMKDRYKITILSSREYILPPPIDKSLFVSSIDDLFDAMDILNVDILILREYSNEIAYQIRNTNIKVIYWSHNYIDDSLCKFIASTPQVKCNVFVGKQQYDSYADNDIIKKSVCIYNIFNDKCSENRINDSKTVVFLGSITSKKGFLEVCRIWKGVVKQVPNAILLVMGSGNLYGKGELGKYGIAKAEFERQCMPFITDKNGDIVDSIQFLGIVGSDKENYFRNASVGIINPSNLRETFGMGIVEMAAAQLPVVSRAKNGYYDTTIPGVTALLSHSLYDIQRDIVKLLRNYDLNVKLGHNAKRYITKFSPFNIMPHWQKLIDDVYNDSLDIEYDHYTSPLLCGFKPLVILNRFFRFSIGLRFLPSIVDIEYFIKRIKRKI